MAERTGISWCDSTFNPWLGCAKISPGCDHCYAEQMMDTHWGKVRWGSGQQRQRTSASNWRQPVQWDAHPFAECVACGWRGEVGKAVVRDGLGETVHVCPVCERTTLKAARRRVFCSSLADVFDNEAPAGWRADLFDLIERTPNLDWLLLTKRIGNVQSMLRQVMRGLTANVWLGATVVNQEEADRDIPKLLATPAAVRFLSIEPMLGPVNMSRLVIDEQGGRLIGAQRGIDWIIAGGESGPRARPAHPDWFRSLRDQCAAADVTFFFKQWGEWGPARDAEAIDRGDGIGGRLSISGRIEITKNTLQRLGTKASGSVLDGAEIKAWPL